MSAWDSTRVKLAEAEEMMDWMCRNFKEQVPLEYCLQERNRNVCIVLHELGVISFMIFCLLTGIDGFRDHETSLEYVLRLR